jgi:hypothetical protein
MPTSSALTTSVLTTSSVDREVFGTSGESPVSSLISSLTVKQEFALWPELDREKGGGSKPLPLTVKLRP